MPETDVPTLELVSPIEGELPFELGWDGTRWPILPAIEQRGDAYIGRLRSGSIDPLQHEAYLACLEAPAIHCAVNGNDDGGDGSAERPVRSIWRAQQIANFSRRSSRIVVGAGLYDGDQNFSGRGRTQATVDTAYLAEGGRVTVTTHRATLAWIGDPALPGCSVTADVVASPARVVDLAPTAQGIYSDLAPVPTAALLVATPMSYLYPSLLTATAQLTAGTVVVTTESDVAAGGWSVGDIVEVAGAQQLTIAAIGEDGHSLTLDEPSPVGGAEQLTLLPKLRVNRGGEGATALNTRVYRTLANFMQLGQEAHRSLFLVGAEAGSGFDLEGGASTESAGACLIVSYAAPGQGDTVVYARDCSFRYAGSYSGAAGNGVQINNVNGLVAFENCEASGNKSDGFNFHDTRNYGVSALLLNCTAIANGMGGSTANNGMTCHEAVRMVVLGGSIAGNAGPSCHAVHESRAFVMGLVSSDSRGDAMYGGCGRPSEIRTSDAARIYAWHVIARPSASNGLGFAATETSVIHKRECPPSTVADFGHVDDYPANTAAWERPPGEQKTAEATALRVREEQLATETRFRRSCAASASAASPPVDPVGSPLPLAQ